MGQTAEPDRATLTSALMPYVSTNSSRLKSTSSCPLLVIASDSSAAPLLPAWSSACSAAGTDSALKQSIAPSNAQPARRACPREGSVRAMRRGPDPSRTMLATPATACLACQDGLQLLSSWYAQPR